ncbi:hypothetical protein BT93_B1479 [Corymbia citriodora subsp. variegata]|nr:hypothetical protein BT93_B1479 [Corymbia citriodora subsp. variegata]
MSLPSSSPYSLLSAPSSPMLHLSTPSSSPPSPSPSHEDFINIRLHWDSIGEVCWYNPATYRKVYRPFLNHCLTGIKSRRRRC